MFILVLSGGLEVETWWTVAIWVLESHGQGITMCSNAIGSVVCDAFQGAILCTAERIWAKGAVPTRFTFAFSGPANIVKPSRVLIGCKFAWYSFTSSTLALLPRQLWSVFGTLIASLLSNCNDRQIRK